MSQQALTKLRFNKHFKFLFNPQTFVTVLQGSAGSGKTYSVLQMMIVKALSGEWQDKTIDIIRRTFPSHRIGAMKDFEDILKSAGLYSRDMHNKTEHIYTIGSCSFRFYSTDDEAKMRGVRRDIAYINEALEVKRMDAMQVMMRTRDYIFMDFNPSEEFHWLYDEIIEGRDDVTFDKSTFKQNPFLSEGETREILNLKDPNLWRIYGLGERGISQTTIFPDWDYWDDTFERFEGEEVYGIDFGYNHPTALIRIKIDEDNKRLLADELLYKSGLTGEMIVEHMKKLVEEGYLTYDSRITGDAARPEIIREAKAAGFNMHYTKKGVKSVMEGLNFLKQMDLYITKESVNLAKELRSYKWKVDNDDNVREEPVKANDHAIDGLRYGVEEKIRGGTVVGSIRRKRGANYE